MRSGALHHLLLSSPIPPSPDEAWCQTHLLLWTAALSPHLPSIPPLSEHPQSWDYIVMPASSSASIFSKKSCMSGYVWESSVHTPEWSALDSECVCVWCEWCVCVLGRLGKEVTCSMPNLLCLLLGGGSSICVSGLLSICPPPAWINTHDHLGKISVSCFNVTPRITQCCFNWHTNNCIY